VSKCSRLPGAGSKFTTTSAKRERQQVKPTSLKDVSRIRAPLTDIPTLRKRARQHIEEGAVTSGYAADRKYEEQIRKVAEEFYDRITRP